MHEKYSVNQVNFSSSERLSVMLLDKIESCLEEAINAIKNKDYEKRWKRNSHACEVLACLVSNINHKNPVGLDLSKLLQYCMLQLSKVDNENSEEAAKHVINLLKPIRNAFNKLDSAETKITETNSPTNVEV